MAKSLDVGTNSLISANIGEDGNIVFSQQRDAFFSLEKNDIAQNMLNDLSVNYIEKENKIHIVGDNALRFASTFNQEARRPMQNGVLSKKDEDAFDMLQEVIKGVLGPPSKEKEVLAYTIPANPIDRDFDIEFHKGILQSIFEEMGYDPHAVIEGNCVVYNELADKQLTGIGMSFGAGMANVCISVFGVSNDRLSFSVAKGGDYIDKRVADTSTKLTASKVTLIKEKGVDIANPKDHVEKAIGIYYTSLIEYILKNMAQKLNTESVPDFGEPVTIAIAGGGCKVGGFLDVFNDTINKIDFPIEIGEVKLASIDPLHTIAAGALNAALLEEKKSESST